MSEVLHSHYATAGKEAKLPMINKLSSAIALAASLVAAGCSSNEGDTAPMQQQPEAAANTCPPGHCADGLACNQGVCYDKNKTLLNCNTDEDCKLFEVSDKYSLCYNGYCAPSSCSTMTCPTESAQCAGADTGCYSAKNNPGHCGGIDITCSSGVCLDGICMEGCDKSTTCPTDKPNCGNGQCLNMMTDVKNCGQVGNACPPDFSNCYLGHCVASTPDAGTVEASTMDVETEAE